MDNLSISRWVDRKSLLLCILWHICLHVSFVDPPANKWMLQSTMRRSGKLVIHHWASLFLLVNLIFLCCIYMIAIVIWYAGVITQFLSIQIPPLHHSECQNGDFVGQGYYSIALCTNPLLHRSEYRNGDFVYQIRIAISD